MRIDPIKMEAEGFLVSRRALAPPQWLQHTRFAVPGGHVWTFASPRAPAPLHALLANMLGEAGESAAFEDAARGDFRTLVFDAGRLETALFVAQSVPETALDYVIEQLGETALSADARLSLIAGRPLAGSGGAGPVICACFGVRRSSIEAAAAAGADSVALIGNELGAGTNCGSCQPELGQIIAGTKAARRTSAATA